MDDEWVVHDGLIIDACQKRQVVLYEHKYPNFADLPDLVQNKILVLTGNKKHSLTRVCKDWRRNLSESICIGDMRKKKRWENQKKKVHTQDMGKILKDIRFFVRYLVLKKVTLYQLGCAVEMCPNLQVVTVLGIAGISEYHADKLTLSKVQKLECNTSLLYLFPNLKQLKTKVDTRGLSSPVLSTLEYLQIENIFIPLSHNFQTPNHYLKTLDFHGPIFTGSFPEVQLLLSILVCLETFRFAPIFQYSVLYECTTLEIKSPELKHLTIKLPKYDDVTQQKAFYWNSKPYLQTLELEVNVNNISFVSDIIPSLKFLLMISLKFVDNQLFPLKVLHGCRYLRILSIDRQKKESITTLSDVIQLCYSCPLLHQISLYGYSNLYENTQENRKKVYTLFPNRMSSLIFKPAKMVYY
eukprot:TRINITY_DN2021_c0_g2_i1.p1 TRINITY_DN2021_c0_g2~~TRINITY_DN2021_c0_g2_i1.p1  ORF type:complete len:411 (-),score=54.91 TRINITY_DN2021_c0_g2_i1:8-1240(-)